MHPREVAPSWRSLAEALIALDARRTSDDLGVIPQSIRSEATVKLWSKPTLSATRRILAQRQEILNQALSLHRLEMERLDIMEKRMRNSLQPVSRLPNELLMMIFRSETRHHSKRAHAPLDPLNLAAVCHKWMAFVMGPGGASLWDNVSVSCDSKDSFIPASRYLGVVLPRSRPLALSLQLRSRIEVDIPMTLDSVPVIYLAAGELDRCRALTVQNVPAYATLFPLARCLPRLEILRLNLQSFEGRAVERQIPSLFNDAEFPNLQRLELSDLSHTQALDIQKKLEGRPVMPRCTELAVSRLRCDTTVFVGLLGAFPHLISLQVNDIRIPGLQELNSSPPAPSQMATLPNLVYFSSNDASSALIITFIIAPALEGFSMNGAFHPGGLVVNGAIHFSEAEVQHLRFRDVGSSMLPGVIGDSAEWTSVWFENDLKELTCALLVLFTFAQEHKSREPCDDELVTTSNRTSRLLVLFPTSDPSNEDLEVKRLFASRLETLAIVRDVRERVYGRDFHIQLPTEFVRQNPAIADVVSRFPGFLEAVAPENIHHPEWSDDWVF